MSIESADQRPGYERDAMTRTNEVVARMRARPLIKDEDPHVLERRKDYIESTLFKLGERAPQLLDQFESIAKKHLGDRVSFKEIALFVVGGNAYGGEFKASSDIDIVFAANPPLDPLAKEPILSYPERIAIGKELVEVIAQTFQADLEQGTYEKGDVELKGIGNQTPDELRERERNERDVVRILSKIWPD